MHFLSRSANGVGTADNASERDKREALIILIPFSHVLSRFEMGHNGKVGRGSSGELNNRLGILNKRQLMYRTGRSGRTFAHEIKFFPFSRFSKWTDQGRGYRINDGSSGTKTTSARFDNFHGNTT